MFGLFGGFSKDDIKRALKEHEAERDFEAQRQQRVRAAMKHHQENNPGKPFIYVEGPPEYVSQVLENNK